MNQTTQLPGNIEPSLEARAAGLSRVLFSLCSHPADVLGRQ